MAAVKGCGAHLDDNGCMTLVGAILHQARHDAETAVAGKGIQKEAKEFITSEKRVHQFLAKYGLAGNISAKYIVNREKEILKGKVFKKPDPQLDSATGN